MKKIYTVFILLLTLVTYFALLSNSNGLATVRNRGYTGAPGEGTTLCGNCHGGTIFGVTSCDITVYDMGTTTPVTEYSPGGSYDIKISVEHTQGNPVGFAFQSTLLDDTDSPIGTTTAVSSNVKVKTTTNALMRTYAEHNGVTSDSVFIFNWTAPSTPKAAGDVTIYAVGNAVNGNGSSGGDTGSKATYSLLLPISPNLPVELAAFDAKLVEGEVLLEWKTLLETNSDQFLVEHAIDAANFSPIGTVIAAGESQAEQKYSYTHNRPSANLVNYYRLKQLDKDGSFTYSDIVSIKLGTREQEMEVFPQPAINKANVALEVPSMDDYLLSVMDVSGRTFLKETYQLEKGMTNLTFDLSDWPAGMYVVNLQSKSHSFSKKLMKL